MTKKHEHASTHQHGDAQHHGPAWKRMHRDWRFWIFLVGVILMLAAMFAYLASDDESIVPAAPQTSATAPAAALA